MRVPTTYAELEFLVGTWFSRRIKMCSIFPKLVLVLGFDQTEPRSCCGNYRTAALLTQCNILFNLE